MLRHRAFHIVELLHLIIILLIAAQRIVIVESALHVSYGFSRYAQSVQFRALKFP